MKYLMIVPVFNEARSIANVIEELRCHCPAYDIVVVNDASSDESLQVVKSLGVKVLDLPANLGIGGAVQAGMRYAVAHGYDAGIQFDGDGQHIAKSVKILVERFEEQPADLIIGSRFLEESAAFKTSFERKIGMILFSKLFFLLSKQKVYDTTSGFRLYGLEIMRFYQDSYPTDFPDMPALIAAVRKGFSIAEVAVEMKQREFGVSSTGFFKSVWYPLTTIAATLAVYLQQ